MSRPHKQGLQYFPHDTDAINDDKIQSLMALYGTEGYAFYFMLLERVFRTENGILPLGKLLEKAGITRVMGITVNRFEEILQSALEIGCFDKDVYDKDKCLTSNGIRKRLEKVNEIRSKERQRKEELKDKYKKKKESNSRKTYGKPTENFIIPTIQEVTDYCLERKNSVNPKKWLDFYVSKGWMIGKNKMKDWRAAVRTWEDDQTTIKPLKESLPYNDLRRYQ